MRSRHLYYEKKRVDKIINTKFRSTKHLLLSRDIDLNATRNPRLSLSFLKKKNESFLEIVYYLFSRSSDGSNTCCIGLSTNLHGDVGKKAFEDASFGIKVEPKEQFRFLSYLMLRLRRALMKNTTRTRLVDTSRWSVSNFLETLFWT